MMLAVFRLGLVMVSILVVNAYSTCILSRTCPCGKSGKNYTRCFETKFQLYSCESWTDCESCEDYNEFCVTCPPGRGGLTCKEELKPVDNISCKHPGIVENGIIEDDVPETEGFPVGTQLRFLCREGYVIDGPKNIFCLSNGQWSKALPNCRLSTKALETKGNRVKREGTRFPFCPELKPPKSGSLICYDSDSSRICFAQCSMGYGWVEHERTVSRFMLTCDQNIWMPRQHLPECKLLSSLRRRILYRRIRGCVLEISEKSSYTCRNGITGVYCDVSCNDKYLGTYHCFPGIGWNSTVPVCRNPTEPYPIQVVEKEVIPKINCPDPGIPKDGGRWDRNGNSIPFPYIFKEDDSVFFICNEKNTTLVGSIALTCKADGLWNGTFPQCVPFHKDDVVNSRKRNEWYVPVAEQPIAKISCTRPGVIENGIIEGFESEAEFFSPRTELRVQCREGYEIEGQKSLYCLSNGYWSASPICRPILTTQVEKVFCEHPGLIENGMFDGDDSMSRFPVDTELEFFCVQGARRIGRKSIYCKENGEWSEKPPVCHAIRPENRRESAAIPMPTVASPKPCKHPGMIENGINEYSASLYSTGSELKFKCREDYTMDGPDTLRCLRDGKWTSSLPSCRPTQRQSDCGRVFQAVYNSTGIYTRSDWPWTVGISTEIEDITDKMFCGGALLNSRTVLTAAHCVTGGQIIKLHFGYRRSAAESVSEQVRNVSRIIIHPEYDDETHSNDLALIKFEPIVHFGRTTQPICLPSSTDSSAKDLIQGTRALVTGYGKEFSASNVATPNFKVTVLPLESEEKCDAVCLGHGLVSCSPSTFCAGYPQDTRECIHGGSPMVIFHPETGRYTLVGLVTRAESARNRWNGKCKLAESHTMFTNVTHFMPFISENLN